MTSTYHKPFDTAARFDHDVGPTVGFWGFVRFLEKECDTMKKLLALAATAALSTVVLAAAGQKLSFDVVGAY